jgi:EmrB/QacA subfamily drug resistance transporter
MSQKTAILVVQSGVLVMSAIDSTIVNVAVPTLGRQFHASPAAVDAVVIGYLLSMAVLIPASGWLCDRLGTRRVLLGAIAVFTAASAACGAAGCLDELIGFRILQGASSGLIGPVGLTMVLRAFPPAERPWVTGILVIPSSFAPALGPVLGGLFVTGLSWRWAFYVNVPVGIASVILGLRYLEEQERHEAGAFDAPGFVLGCAGLATLMYGLSEGPDQGWDSPAVLVTLSAGAVLLTALARVELRRRQPLIDVRLLADRLFRSSNVVMFLVSACYGGALFLVTLFYQDGLGLTALQSGLSVLPEALGVIVGAPLMARRVYPVLGPRRLITGGLAGITAGLAALSLVNSRSDLWLMWLLLLALGFSIAGVTPSANITAFSNIGPAATGRASAFYSAQRQAAGAIGVAVLTTVLTAVGASAPAAGHPAGDLAGYHVAFLAAAGLAALAAFAAATIRDEDAANTIVKRARPARSADER